MTHFGWLDNGYPTLPYGLGLMLQSFRLEGESTSSSTWLTDIIGHEGGDYGSGTYMAGWNRGYNFSIMVGMGSAYGMNCSLSPDVTLNWRYAQQETDCLLHSAALSFFSNGTAPVLNCGSPMASSIQHALHGRKVQAAVNARVQHSRLPPGALVCHL